MEKDGSTSQEAFDKMRHRSNKKALLFYPEDQNKNYWDLSITLVLLISCMITPWRIAFGDLDSGNKKEPIEWTIINWVIDSLFIIDICVIFNSAFHDDDFNIVEDRKKIAMMYIQGWFIIDLLAIIPFDILL